MAQGLHSGGADTKEKLVAAAAQEFLDCGYDGTSLRQICAAAGVTTGALYFFFKNKEDLFRAVIAPVSGSIEEVLGRFGDCTADVKRAELADLAATTVESPMLRDFLDLCYEERTASLIMVRNLETPTMVAGYNKVVQTFASNIRDYVVCPEASEGVWDDIVVEWVAETVLDAIIEVLQNDDTIEDARRHIGVILDFMNAGAAALNAKSRVSDAEG